MTLLVAIAVGAVLAALWLSLVRLGGTHEAPAAARDSSLPGSRVPDPGSPLAHPSQASCCQPGGCGCGRRLFEEDC
jgi:hypothetical protein